MHILFESIEETFNSISDTANLIRSFSHEDSYDDLSEFFESIVDYCDEAKVYEGYSGRGMYGRKCWGIQGSDMVQIIEIAAQHGLRDAKVDNLGRDYIVYWPDVVFVKD